jgi:pilus assembly protein Flp/PilA
MFFFPAVRAPVLAGLLTIAVGNSIRCRRWYRQIFKRAYDLFQRIHSSGGTMEKLTNLFLYAHSLVEREEGQDLVEYALVVALIAFGAIAAMQFLATGINNAFSDISNVLTSNIT